jgi:hypothetical protein
MTAAGNRLRLVLPGIILDFAFAADGAIEYNGGYTAADNLDITVTPGTFNRYVSVCHGLSSLLIL